MDKKSSKENPGKRHDRPKKRKFHGNRYLKQQDESEAGSSRDTSQAPTLSASRKKLRDSEQFKPVINQNFQYVILEFFTVFNFVSTVVKCKECESDVRFEMCSFRGHGFKVKVVCEKCPESFGNSCPMIENSYEINRRMAFCMRVLGIGYSGLKLFCGLMDMALPVAKSFFVTQSEKIRDACKSTAEYIMNKAFAEELQVTQEKNFFEDPKGIAANLNESYNQLVWKITPKSKPGSSTIVELATYISEGLFNEGHIFFISTMKTMGITMGPICERECQERDLTRIVIGEERAKKSTKEFRMELRRARLQTQDQIEAEDGKMYGAGIAD